MPICQNCNKPFSNKFIDEQNKAHSLASRRFCLDCSPFNTNNTRKYIVKLKKGEAYCARCGEIKNTKQFYTRANGKPLSYCMDCQLEVKHLTFEINIERLIDEKGGKCSSCEIVFPWPVYEFYADGNTYSLGRGKHLGFAKLKEELENYEIMCKNCVAINKWELK